MKFVTRDPRTLTFLTSPKTIPIHEYVSRSSITPLKSVESILIPRTKFVTHGSKTLTSPKPIPIREYVSRSSIVPLKSSITITSDNIKKKVLKDLTKEEYYDYLFGPYQDLETLTSPKPTREYIPYIHTLGHVEHPLINTESPPTTERNIHEPTLALNTNEIQFFQTTSTTITSDNVKKEVLKEIYLNDLTRDEYYDYYFGAYLDSSPKNDTYS
jgi:hypothetical protein